MVSQFPSRPWHKSFERRLIFQFLSAHSREDAQNIGLKVKTKLLVEHYTLNYSFRPHKVRIRSRNTLIHLQCIIIVSQGLWHLYLIWFTSSFCLQYFSALNHNKIWPLCRDFIIIIEANRYITLKYICLFSRAER